MVDLKTNETDPRDETDPEGWMLSKSGRRFWPMMLEPEDVALEDIAHALASESRFGGHTTEPYSVAQHSVLVATIVLEEGAPKSLVRAALFHDAHEAYLKDVPTMIKRAIGPAYREACDRADYAIGRALGIEPHLFSSLVVKQADLIALATEKRDIRCRPESDGIDAVKRHGVKPHPKKLSILDWRSAKRAFYNMAIMVAGPGERIETPGWRS